MKGQITIALLALTVQSGVSAQEAFEGWPEDKATTYCGAMAMFNQYLNRDENGELPPYTEDQAYWWDATVALHPDKDVLQQELTLAGQSFEAYFLKVSKNESNPNVTRKALAEVQDVNCSKYRIERKIAELTALRKEQQLTVDAYREIQRREEAEAKIAFDAPPFVNLESNPQVATLDVYFSLGCNHCLLFLDQNLDSLLDLNSRGRLNLRFLEVPGLVPPLVGSGRTDRPTLDAATRATEASRYAACAAAKSPSTFTRFLSRLIEAAKTQLPHIESVSWEYYAHALPADFLPASPYRSVDAMLEYAAGPLGVSTQSCDPGYMQARSAQAQDIVKSLRGAVSVPFFRFNGRYYQEPSRYAHIMQDIKDYVDSQSADSP